MLCKGIWVSARIKLIGQTSWWEVSILPQPNQSKKLWNPQSVLPAANMWGEVVRLPRENWRLASGNRRRHFASRADNVRQPRETASALTSDKGRKTYLCCHREQTWDLDFPYLPWGMIEVIPQMKLKWACYGIFCPAGEVNFILWDQMYKA